MKFAVMSGHLYRYLPEGRIEFLSLQGQWRDVGTARNPQWFRDSDWMSFSELLEDLPSLFVGRSGYQMTIVDTLI